MLNPEPAIHITNHPGLPEAALSQPDEFRTVRQALGWAGQLFRQEGLPDPRLSAELLLGSVLSLDRIGLLLHDRRILDKTESLCFEGLVRRRAGHEPIAYLLGQKEFWSLNFFVNPQVLIPRPETELLVEESLKILSAWSGRRTVVELGTGSGAVSIALIKSLNRPGSVRFLATDISRGALKTARKNAAFHGLDQTIGLVQGDWLKPFASGRKWIDLLISNPPYISESEMSRLPATVRRFEPAPALLAGPDGLAAIRSILAQAAGQLKPGGRLILEIGETQGREVLDLAHGYRFVQTAILKDYSGKDRLLTACCHG